MPVLQIDLQDGFDGNDVTIRVDGHEVYRKAAVTTNTVVSFADTVRVEPDGPAATVEVEAGARVPASTFTVDLDRPAFVGISIAADGTMEHVISHEKFRYA